MMEINLSNLNGINFNGQPVQSLVIGGDTIWNAGGSPSPVVVDEYFTIEATSSGYISVKAANNNYKVTLYVWKNTTPNAARDNYTSVYTSSTSPSQIIVDSGDKIRLYRNASTGWAKSSNISYYNYFITSCNAKIYGDIGSLVNYATTLPQYGFYSLFKGCTKITDASGLGFSFDTVERQCMDNMFSNCTGLLYSPTILPALNLGYGSYGSMFSGCTNLLTAPELPATSFSDARPYRLMFQNCMSLTTAPDLPAGVLTANAYQNMFFGCKSLNYIKCLATDISATSCTSSWVASVSSTGTFVKKAGVSWPTGESGIPNGWTVIEE